MNSIVTGSISAIATQTGKSLAETFMHAEMIVIVDTSGSMNGNDSRGGKTRYTIACEELAGLQASMPGKIGVLSFANDVIFCPGGVPQYQGGSTDLAKALRYAKMADVPDMRFVVISDGEPDDPADALKVAATYQNRIDVIYVGPETSSYGREFLAKLAQQSGGKIVTADRAKELKQAVIGLLA